MRCCSAGLWSLVQCGRPTVKINTGNKKWRDWANKTGAPLFRPSSHQICTYFFDKSQTIIGDTQFLSVLKDSSGKHFYALSLRCSRVVFGAGCFSSGGNQPWKPHVTERAWKRVCWDNAANPISCCRPGDFGGTLSLAANIFQCVSGHPEAARPDVQPSGLRGEALSLTLQTLNNAHRSLRLMSPLHREHRVRALPVDSIRASYLGSRAFYARAGTRPENLIQNANQHWAPGGGSSLFVSQGGRWRVTVSVDQDAECGKGTDRQASFRVNCDFKLHQAVKCFYICGRD